MKNNVVKGTSQGLIAGLMWGLDTVFSAMALSMFPFISLKSAAIVAPFVGVFFHDSLSGVWTFIYILITGKIKDLFKAVKRKSIKTVIAIGFLAGPVAMTGYYGAVNYMGASNAATVTAIYPAVGALFSSIVLKEKLNYKAWIGLGVSILGVIILGWGGNSQPLTLVGIGFAVMAVLGWGGETVLCAVGLEADENLRPEFVLQIRQMISGLTYFLIFLPLLGALPIARDVILHRGTLFMFILAALAGTISIIFYYKTIDSVGPTKAMGLNSTCSIWAMIFALGLQGKSITISMIIASVVVIFGTMLMVSQPRVRRK
ncbi:DMT family transporter [uncultured Clostridium sp.]|uniref:DMT family transporter n=1 Tax=uncultured Clostridium sp. TaxID=59620 RepID=UPI00263811B6|nr:DMT family transporter [uncultured Clostridium sp.]